MSDFKLHVISPEDDLLQIHNAIREKWYAHLTAEQYEKRENLLNQTVLAKNCLTTFVGQENGEFVSTVKAFSLKASIDNQPVDAWLSSTLLALPRKKGTGLFGVKTIQHLKKLAVEKKVDLIIGFSEVDLSYYQRIGYQLIPNYLAYARVPQTPQRWPKQVEMFNEDEPISVVSGYRPGFQITQDALMWHRVQARFQGEVMGKSFSHICGARHRQHIIYWMPLYQQNILCILYFSRSSHLSKQKLLEAAISYAQQENLQYVEWMTSSSQESMVDHIQPMPVPLLFISPTQRFVVTDFNVEDTVLWL